MKNNHSLPAIGNHALAGTAIGADALSDGGMKMATIVITRDKDYGLYTEVQGPRPGGKWHEFWCMSPPTYRCAACRRIEKHGFRAEYGKRQQICERHIEIKRAS